MDTKRSFLDEILADLHLEPRDFKNCTFIVPSKRAGLFLQKKIVAQHPDTSFFAPVIYSIESFISKVSGLKPIREIQSLFEFYETYRQFVTNGPVEPFESYCQWATTLLQDFSEMDRYCIPAPSFFGYLSDIQDINHWSLQKEKTELIEKYLEFWKNLIHYYEDFTNRLASKGIGYQGMLYRFASQKIEAYAAQNKHQKHILLGFNALNQAEQKIFQTLLHNASTKIYWDTDRFFFSQPSHAAAIFLRKYKNEWKYYENNPFSWIKNHFSDSKNIHCIGVASTVGQAKAAANILGALPAKTLKNTALVLADENLLPAVLSEIPKSIGGINITMGLPLNKVPLAVFFEKIFSLQSSIRPDGTLHYNAILTLLRQQVVQALLGQTAQALIQKIIKENIIFINYKYLEKVVSEAAQPLVLLLFSSWRQANTAISNCIQICSLLIDFYKNSPQILALEYAHRFAEIFKTIQHFQQQYNALRTIKAVHRVYLDILHTETLDIQGEPFAGLQIMGVLETRCLDYETVIITSVNEGVLPAGKSNNSFLPFDLKKSYGLPTYKEKDAIYAYHFYRILQRAKTIYLIHNSSSEGIGGVEKSRFIHQLDIDQREKHSLTHKTWVSQPIRVPASLRSVAKTKAIMETLQSIAKHGFSPSALISYIKNPLDFYHRYILKIKESDQVEETIAASTLGTVIHKVLESFYKPLEGKQLQLSHLDDMLANVETEIRNQFQMIYSKSNYNRGANRITIEVVKKYLENFLKSECKNIEKGHALELLAIEKEYKVELTNSNFAFPVYLRGKIDRIDRFGEQIRIIDYKTGKISKSDLEIQDLHLLDNDPKHTNVIQLLCYALLLQGSTLSDITLRSGIVPLKNRNTDFLAFGIKTKKGVTANSEITSEILSVFEQKIYQLIEELFDWNIDFVERKEV